eukprot:jgi/Tetstr1/423224/TSEL_001342.t1
MASTGTTLLLMVAVAALAGHLGLTHALTGVGGGMPGVPANLDPELLRQALNRYPGTTPACVDGFINQMTTCESYFGNIQERFPDLQRANAQEVINFVVSNPPDSACCAVISDYNGRRCICEPGTLPLARQFPERYWGLLEAGRCENFQGAVVTPDAC